MHTKRNRRGLVGTAWFVCFLVMLAQLLNDKIQLVNTENFARSPYARVLIINPLTESKLNSEYNSVVVGGVTRDYCDTDAVLSYVTFSRRHKNVA